MTVSNIYLCFVRCFKEREEFYLFGDGGFLDMEEELDPEARRTAESEGLMMLEDLVLGIFVSLL